MKLDGGGPNDPGGSAGNGVPAPVSAPATVLPTPAPAEPTAKRLRAPGTFRRLAGLFGFGRYSSGLSRLIDEKMADGRTPYFHACTVSEPQLTGIEIGKFPGLLSCHSVQDAQGRRQVYSYWAGRRSFERYGDAFRQALPGAAEVSSGYLSHTKVKAKNLWQRFPFWTVVITVSGVFGAFAALWDHGARLLEPPDLTVVFKRENRLDFDIAETPVLTFEVVNQCRFALAAVRIRSAIARPGEPADPGPEGARLSRIEPGKAAEFDMEADISKAMSVPGPPQYYELRLWVTAKAGLWRAEKPFSFSSPKFRQWRPVSWSKPEKAKTSGTACYLQGTFYLGRARSATAVVTAVMPAKVDSVVTQLFHASQLDSEPSPSGEVRRQEAPTGELQSFLDYPYIIKVSSSGMSDAACSQLAQTPDLLRFR